MSQSAMSQSTMNKIAFIYPGQGVQKPGMGKDFYETEPLAKRVYDKASEILELDMKTLCFQENEKLDQTEYTQVALLTTSLAMTESLMERGVKPQVTAGLSLGEYCAIVAAGGMRLEDAISVVRKRGILMQNAVPLGKGAMSAVLGLDSGTIEGVLESISGVSIANYNCPGQIVITGELDAIVEAEDALKEAGARRVVRLNVSGPFHSAMLEEAGVELERELEKIELSELLCPYVSNVTAEYINDIKEIKSLLIKQISDSVRWEQSIRTMIADGVDTFIEIGPGKTLSGFMKKIDRNVAMHHIEQVSDIQDVLEKLGVQ